MDQASYIIRSRTLTISLVSTGLSLIPTFYAAFISNSLTLFADLLRCLVEFLAILAAFIIARMTRPENLQKYNYGFGKLEHLSSLVVAAAMLMAFIIMTLAAAQRLFSPQAITNTGFGLILAICSVGGNIYIWQRNVKLARVNASPITAAQSRLFLSKAIACLVVVITLCVGMYLNNSFIGMHSDALGSMAVAGFLLYSSYNMIFHSLGEMLDASLEEGAQLLILKSLVKFESSYKNISRIRTRQGGAKNYIELSLEFNGALTLSEIHEIAKSIRKEIEDQIPAAEVVVIPLPA